MNQNRQQFSRESVCILLLFLLFLSLRVIHLSADPPDNLSLESGGEYGDPGNYALNARNKVLFGQWQIDDFAGMYVVPVPHFVTYGSFLVFGVGIWQMNLVPLFFSALCWLGLFLLASRYFPRSSLLFFFLLSLNYAFGIYSRINDQVMPMTFFVILAVYFFIGAWDRPKYFFWTALCLSLSFLSKEKILYFHLIVVPLSFVFILLRRGELGSIKLNVRRIAYFLSGSVPVAVLWTIFLYIPHRTVYDNLLGLNATHMVPKSLTEAVGNWLRRPPFDFHPANAVLTFLLFLYLLTLLFTWFKKSRKEEAQAAPGPLEIICSVWLVVGLGLNSLISYHPIRHYIEFSIPLLILSSIFLSRLTASFRLKTQLKNRPVFSLWIFLLIWIGVTAYSRRLFSRETFLGRPEKVLLITTFFALALTALLYLAIRIFFASKDIILPTTAAVVLAVLLIALYSFQNLKSYVQWAAHATYNLKTIGQDLGRAFPQGVFCGLLAPSLSLENRNKAHTAMTNYANDEPDFLERQKVTHLIVGTYNDEAAFYEKHHAEEWKRAKFLVRYWLWRSWFLLYEIQAEPALPLHSPFYEAEQMVRDIGQPRYDPRAGNGFAVWVDKNEKGIIGKEKVFFPSKTRLQGRLYVKLGDKKTEGSLLLLRIWKKGTVIYKKPMAVPGEDFVKEYKPIGFELLLPEAGEYEFEIQSSGGQALFFDRLELNTDF